MSIPLILASQSPSRREVLYSAGICPTIRVSHVDEPEVLRKAAERSGIDVESLDVEKRVQLLADAKAQSVYLAYRSVVETCAKASGSRVVAYPLRAAQTQDNAEEAQKEADELKSRVLGRAQLPTQTRSFAGLEIPTSSEPISTLEIMHPGLTQLAAGPLIVGCDSMFFFDGECYGKPHTVEVARKRLSAMRGGSGELWTGHCVIDFATGKSARAVSRAVIHFGEYSDRDIERYIATREPLEVAGSFTLEGFGGAFIEGIEGDPHGVIGLSLPLLRHCVAELGIEWTDLWNVARGASSPAIKADVASGDIPPADNVHQPGDGWVDCACGRRHWGLNGAAGVLLARRDSESGKVTQVVMQHRAAWSAEGGTWGIPGGALTDAENACEGALRESYEEANIRPEDIDIIGSYREEHGNWAYTTVLAFEKEGHTVLPHANDDESMSIEWVPVSEVENRTLLTAFRSDWPMLRNRLERMAAEL